MMFLSVGSFVTQDTGLDFWGLTRLTATCSYICALILCSAQVAEIDFMFTLFSVEFSVVNVFFLKPAAIDPTLQINPGDSLSLLVNWCFSVQKEQHVKL